MRYLLIFLLFYGWRQMPATAQTPSEFQPFVPAGFTFESAIGPGLKEPNGDILMLVKNQDFDDFLTLILLRKSKGRLVKLAENGGLLMNKDLLGIAGGNYPDLDQKSLTLAYTLGSNSGQSEISIVFEKNNDENYYFKEYTLATYNYGVENLFKRQLFTAKETGSIPFATATEAAILAHAKPAAEDDEKLEKAKSAYKKYIPKNWQLGAAATGDLNEDAFKKDLLLFVYHEKEVSVQLLLEQKDGSYQVAKKNNLLFSMSEDLNIRNVRVAVKNGFLTIEQRVALADLAYEDGGAGFVHRYFTFKYDPAKKEWLTYRYGVEKYQGFDSQPLKKATQYTQGQIGRIPFQQVTNYPDDAGYEPAISTLSGTLTKKMFYGAPNYGETPEKDAKEYVWILKLEVPLTVYPTGVQDLETGNSLVSDVLQIQVYDPSGKQDLKRWQDKKLTLQGMLEKGFNAHHRTPVLLKVGKVIP